MRMISWIALAIGCVALPFSLPAQDTTHVRPDTAKRDTLRKAARLNQVTITATPVERSEPLTVAHIDTLNLARTPANSPWELFRQAAGLEVHEQGQGPGFASDLSIRGFSSDHSTDLALYIDGVPNNESVNGHSEGYNDLNLLFPQIITGIDVLKGPTSALYGNFAFGGVMNVRTLDRYDGGELSGGGGSFGNGHGYAITGFDHGTSGGVLAIQGFREDGWRPNSENQYGHLHAATVHDLSQNTTIDAAADGYLTSYRSPGFLDTTLYNAGHYNFVSNFNDEGFKRHAQERVSIRSFIGSSLEWRTTVYAQQGFWQFWLSTPPGLGGLTEGTGAETREYDSRSGVGATTAMTYAASGVDITIGADTRFSRATYQNYAEASTGFHVDSVPLALALPARQLSGGIYLQSGFDVSRFVRIDLGGRVDQLSTAVRQPVTDTSGNLVVNRLYDSQHSKGIFSPKIGVMVRPFGAIGQAGVGLFANVSRGFRQTDGVITDPTLPFITVWDYETGVKLDEGRLSMDASLFRMDVSNEQSFDPALNTVVGGGQSRRDGLDVSAHAEIARGVKATTDFTILHGFYTNFVDPNDGNDYTGVPIFNTSKYVGTALIDINVPHARWFGQLGGNFQGPYTPFEEPGITRSAYLLVNITAGLTLRPKTDVMISARNLFNTTYRELESGGQASPGQGRTIYAELRYKAW